ncbi:Gp15 family bacteriophage protein [Bacillus benzoevorans]|uniref:Bacteriophage Gp15 protein n=1 Tax=Bacillus benzoevorans TaxID=1456 RepID=A0A7X0LWB2_9BACI|nr:Gp15 family bacteriophage protein [Bacillus benzoevorans]MBB6446455.1 hypothetical protein [Bacillus benzoevorans]
MSFLLTDTFNDSFKYEGNTVHLNLSFDNVLRIFDLFNDELFNAHEKIEIALQMLIPDYDPIRCVNIREKNALLLFIFREYLDMDLEEKSEQENKKIFDFNQDAGMIYASFLHCYHMDLFEQHGKLHWKKFLQLFQHMDDKAKIKEVMGIRKMPIPKMGKGNEEYRKQIAEMKRIYSLEQPENEERAQEKINKTFDSLANTFKKGR